MDNKKPRCEKCDDVKYISVWDNGYEFLQECECLQAEINLERIERSGMANAFKIYNFDNYITSKAWQVKIKEKALTYSLLKNDDWFYIGGQNGSGIAF